MTNDNDIRQGRHCIFLMQVNLVFVTKYRREIFTKAILDGLCSIFTGVRAAAAPLCPGICSGAPIKIIRQCIEQQQAPH